MPSILSIQSHVVFGYVGNKAATYPLQSMGYDVWPLHTVQFSNHTGYGRWRGEIFPAEHATALVDGIFDVGQQGDCGAILSGYMGSRDMCEAVHGIVKKFKRENPGILYLCDPVMGNTHCYVRPEVVDFFRTFWAADIMTPNQYEAELLSGVAMEDGASVARVVDFFHARGVALVVITGAMVPCWEGLQVIVSDGTHRWRIAAKSYPFAKPINGTGDLFSALLLGAYLRDRDAGAAVCRAVFFVEEVLRHSYEGGLTELSLLSVRYDTEVPEKELPRLIPNFG
jgi:pyridoxine kinase